MTLSKDDTAAQRDPPSGPLRRNRDFLLLWSGAGLSMLGYRMSTVAYPLLAIWYLDSTVGAGLIGFASLLPMLLVQLPAGVLVDRCDRRRVMIGCDIVGCVAMASLVVWLLADRLWLGHLMAVAFIEGSAAIVYRLAERAAVRNVVHPQHLPAALSQNEARAQAAGLIGQPAGSSLFAVARWTPFLSTAVGHVLSLIGLLFVKAEFQAERRAGPSKLRSELLEGITWLRGQRFLRAAVFLVAGSNLLFQISGLAIILVVKENGGSPTAIGVIGAVSGVGGVLGSLFASRLLKHLAPRTILVGAFSAWAAVTSCLALTTGLYAIGGLMALVSFVGASMNVSAGVYQVQTTPDGLQGRVTSVAMLVSSGSNSIGSIVGGVVLSTVSTTHTITGVAAVMFLLAVLAALSPAVRSAGESPLLAKGQGGEPPHGGRARSSERDDDG